jgi:hypothetical protein
MNSIKTLHLTPAASGGWLVVLSLERPGQASLIVRPQEALRLGRGKRFPVRGCLRLVSLARFLPSSRLTGGSGAEVFQTGFDRSRPLEDGQERQGKGGFRGKTHDDSLM